MSAGTADGISVEPKRSETRAEVVTQTWVAWPIDWSAVWAGTLAALAAVLVFGLVGIAIGAHLLGPEHRVVDLRKIGLGSLAFSVFASFLAFVIGGWVAGKVAGILRSEPAILHGAIVWLTAVPLLVVLAALGAGNTLGAWNAGLVVPPARGATDAPFERPEQPGPGATESERTQYRAEVAEYRAQVKQWQDDSPRVARNTALGAVTALLLGLVGSVIGGWMASGEPMTLTYYRTRQTAAPGPSA